MFDDDVSHPLYLLGLIRCSFERYVLLAASWHGFALATAASSYHTLSGCSSASDVSEWLLVVGCLQLFGLVLLGSLRDRRRSLQVRWVFALKATQTALALLTYAALLATTAVLTVHVKHYFDSNPSSASAPLSICPPTHSFLLVTAAVAIPLSILCTLAQLVALLSLIYHRLVFMRPPTKTFQDDRERDALTWVRSRTGAIIPTLLIVPPSVDLSRCEAGVFPASSVLLYSHGNAMDLSDSVYVLRAFAESFDCACLGYEYVGYGMCAGSPSEDECNAAIEAAYECLIAYHHAEPSQIILYGRSLGSGPSTHLAHLLQSHLGGLVLQSAMQSVLRAAVPCLRSTLWCDMFANCDLLSSLTLPVLLLHGVKDTVVPFSHAERMYSLLSPDSRFPPLYVADGTHDNMPKPWIHSRSRSEKDSEERYREKMRVNERNQTYITRVKEFIQHCALRTQHMRAAHIAVGLDLPALQAQKAMLEQQSNAAAVAGDVVHPESEQKVADDGSPPQSPVVAVADTAFVSSPSTAGKHAIFGLSVAVDGQSAVTTQPAPLLTPLSSLSRLTSLRSPPLSTAPSAAPTPRGLYSAPFTPSAVNRSQLPPLISLPSQLPLFSPPPLMSIPSSHALDDDSPPSHIRSQSATAAIRASSRLTSFPRSSTLHRRAITANTIARETPQAGQGRAASGGRASSAALERLMEDERTTEIRLVREDGVGGGWRVEPGGVPGDAGLHSQTRGMEPRGTLSAQPRGSFSLVTQSTRDPTGSGGGEEKEASAVERKAE